MDLKKTGYGSDDSIQLSQDIYGDDVLQNL
jgi:hypothetical protein